MLVVAVDDDDREVGVVAGDGLGGLARLTAISVGVWPSSRTWRAMTFSAPGSSSARRIRSARCPFSLPTQRPHVVRVPAYTGRLQCCSLVSADRPPRPAVRPSTPALVFDFERHARLRATSLPQRTPPGWPLTVTVAAGEGARAGGAVNRAERIARSSRATSTSATRSTARCSSSASCRSRASSRAATSAPRSPSTTSSRSRPSGSSRRSTASTSSARSRSRATRCRRSSARSSATSATARGRCASRATCRSSR